MSHRFASDAIESEATAPLNRAAGPSGIPEEATLEAAHAYLRGLTHEMQELTEDVRETKEAASHPSGHPSATVTDAELRQALADARHRLGVLYGDRLHRVVLYGSRARGDAAPDSDVDVLVVLKPTDADDSGAAAPVNTLLEIRKLVRVETQLFERYRLHFSFQPYDVETYEAEPGARRPFIQNVRADAVEL